MKKLNNTKTTDTRDTIYFLFLAIIIAVSFLFLIPKVSSSIFPQKQKLMLVGYITSVQKSNHLDLQKYWEFREFYSPGYFKYEKSGLTENKDLQIIELYTLDKSATPQLLFTSPKVLSIGGRTKNKNFPFQKINSERIILKTPTEIITDNNKAYTIVYLKPVTDVKKANGFLENESNENILLGNYWLEITTIQKN